ncbi:MAG: hypothetical protein AAGI53_11760 [Planctomycetota bacterium]
MDASEFRAYSVPPSLRADAVRLIYEAGNLLDQPVRAEDISVVNDVAPDRILIKAPSEMYELVWWLLEALVVESASFEVHREIFVIKNCDPEEVVSLLQRVLAAESGMAVTSAVTPDGANNLALRLVLDELTSRVIAFGTEPELSRVRSRIGSIDIPRRLVALEVLIVSLSEVESLDFGVELRQRLDDAGTLAELSSLFGLSDTTANDDEITPPTGSGGTAVILDPRDFSVVVRSLANVSDGRSLSQTTFHVSNNESASINPVVQEPFLSTNASDTVATTSFGGSQSAGRQVSVTPRMGEGDHLTLEYTVSLSAFVGESADPALPPPSQESNLQSSATIPDGFAVVVGGVELTQEAEATSAVPVLGSIPVLGELFKSQSRSRVCVLIRPSVLRETGFEELRYLAERAQSDLGLPPDWLTLSPEIIR